MNTLTERLRELDQTGYQPLTGAIGDEAAREIESLRYNMHLNEELIGMIQKIISRLNNRPELTEAKETLRLWGYIQPSDVPLFSRAEKVYVVDEEGFDGCTVALYIKENQNDHSSYDI